MRINKSELSKKIGQLKGIVPSRTTIEALKGVLCSDGYLIASDTNLTVKAKLEGMEEEQNHSSSLRKPLISLAAFRTGNLISV